MISWSFKAETWPPGSLHHSIFPGASIRSSRQITESLLNSLRRHFSLQWMERPQSLNAMIGKQAKNSIVLWIRGSMDLLPLLHFRIIALSRLVIPHKLSLSTLQTSIMLTMSDLGPKTFKYSKSCPWTISLAREFSMRLVCHLFYRLLWMYYYSIVVHQYLVLCKTLHV